MALMGSLDIGINCRSAFKTDTATRLKFAFGSRRPSSSRGIALTRTSNTVQHIQAVLVLLMLLDTSHTWRRNIRHTLAKAVRVRCTVIFGLVCDSLVTLASCK